jgi:hypothetical protein
LVPNKWIPKAGMIFRATVSDVSPTHNPPRYEIVPTGEVHDGPGDKSCGLLELRATPAFPDFRYRDP